MSIEWGLNAPGSSGPFGQIGLLPGWIAQVRRLSYRPATMTGPATIFALFLLLNGWTLLRFRQDKARAITGERRISEASLLTLALIGGSPGALLARRLFRHKTRKQPFSAMLWSIVILQLATAVGWLVIR
jgi:uncharacterized membrane protein YsdA (DUF1294 family)